MPDSLISRMTSATKLMCSFWASEAPPLAAVMPLIRTDRRSPDQVDVPENVCPGMVEVGTPMQ